MFQSRNGAQNFNESGKKKWNPIPTRHQKIKRSLERLNLTSILPLIEACYSGRGGGRPRQDISLLLRSLILMQLLEEKSINRWAQRLRDSPKKARLIGYQSPDETPAPSTYYNFIYRILDHYNAERPAQITDRVNISSNIPSPSKSSKPSDEFRHHGGIS